MKKPFHVLLCSLLLVAALVSMAGVTTGPVTGGGGGSGGGNPATNLLVYGSPAATITNSGLPTLRFDGGANPQANIQFRTNGVEVWNEYIDKNEWQWDNYNLDPVFKLYQTRAARIYGPLTNDGKIYANGGLQDTNGAVNGYVYTADASGNGTWQPKTTTKIYSALISQAGTNNPTVTVLENTVGSIVWTRNAAGSYRGTLSGAFLEPKTFLITQSISLIQGLEDGPVSVQMFRGSNDYIEIQTGTSGGSIEDDRIVLHPIEIRVYP